MFVYKWTARAQGRQTRLRGGTLDDGPRSLVALDGRAGGRGNRRGAPRARRPVPRAVLGLSPRPGEQPAAGVYVPVLPRTDRRPAGVDLALSVRAGPVQHAAAPGRMRPARDDGAHQRLPGRPGLLAAERRNAARAFQQAWSKSASRSPGNRSRSSGRPCWLARAAGCSTDFRAPAPRCPWERGSAAAWIRPTGASSSPASGGCPRTWSRPSASSAP